MRTNGGKTGKVESGGSCFFLQSSFSDRESTKARKRLHYLFCTDLSEDDMIFALSRSSAALSVSATGIDRGWEKKAAPPLPTELAALIRIPRRLRHSLREPLRVSNETGGRRASLSIAKGLRQLSGTLTNQVAALRSCDRHAH